MHCPSTGALRRARRAGSGRPSRSSSSTLSASPCAVPALCSVEALVCSARSRDCRALGYLAVALIAGHRRAHTRTAAIAIAAAHFLATLWKVFLLDEPESAMFLALTLALIGLLAAPSARAWFSC